MTLGISVPALLSGSLRVYVNSTRKIECFGLFENLLHLSIWLLMIDRLFGTHMHSSWQAYCFWFFHLAWTINSSLQLWSLISTQNWTLANCSLCLLSCILFSTCQLLVIGSWTRYFPSFNMHFISLYDIFSLKKYRQYTLWTLLLDEIYVGSIS